MRCSYVWIYESNAGSLKSWAMETLVHFTREVRYRPLGLLPCPDVLLLPTKRSLLGSLGGEDTSVFRSCSW